MILCVVFDAYFAILPPIWTTINNLYIIIAVATQKIKKYCLLFERFYRYSKKEYKIARIYIEFGVKISNTL
jgi:hypothetical protein